MEPATAVLLAEPHGQHNTWHHRNFQCLHVHFQCLTGVWWRAAWKQAVGSLAALFTKKKNILKYRQTRRKLLQAVFWFLPFGCIVGAFLFWNSIELGCEILPFHLLFLITSSLWLYSSYCWNGVISLNAIYLCKRDGWACSFWQSHDPHASMRTFAYDTKETPLAACENLNEDEMPEHLAEMGISAEDSYQESA